MKQLVEKFSNNGARITYTNLRGHGPVTKTLLPALVSRKLTASIPNQSLMLVTIDLVTGALLKAEMKLEAVITDVRVSQFLIGLQIGEHVFICKFQDDTLMLNTIIKLNTKDKCLVTIVRVDNYYVVTSLKPLHKES